jgi:hypothetical protein
MAQYLRSTWLVWGVAALSCLGLATPSGQKVPRAGRTYVDPTYGFRLSYPKDFSVRRQDVAKLPRFTPAPLVSIFFMNKTMAQGALAGIEPPDLEVRVYRAGAADSLQSWLVAVGLASAESVAAARPFRNASVGGLQVCRSTPIAPACSVYVLRGDRVYQLTAISLEGEAMIQTFALAPGHGR